MMTRFLYFGIFFQSVIVLIQAFPEKADEEQYYEYTLDADGRYLEGRIQDDAPKGNRVPIIRGNTEWETESNQVTNLRIIIKENKNRKIEKSNNGTSDTNKELLADVSTILIENSTTPSTSTTYSIIPTKKTQGLTPLQTRKITPKGNSFSMMPTTTTTSSTRLTSKTRTSTTLQSGSKSQATGYVEISSIYNTTSTNEISTGGTGRKRRDAGNTGKNEMLSMADLSLKNLSLRVRDTETFDVDEFFFIIVNDSSKLKDADMDEFFVIVCAYDGREVSTPIPFVVRINHKVHVDTSTGYPAAAAIFSGALLLFIIFLAILIPLVTRAKRRYKAGKPLFMPGSHPSSADLTAKRQIQRDTSEPNWYGNNTYDYTEEVEMGKLQFTSTIRDIESNREANSVMSAHNSSVAEGSDRRKGILKQSLSGNSVTDR